MVIDTLAREKARTGHFLPPRYTQFSSNSFLSPPQHDQFQELLTLLQESLVVQPKSQIESFPERLDRSRSKDLRSQEMD